MSITKSNESYTDIKGLVLNSSSMLRMFNILKDDSDYFLNIFKNYEIDSTIITDPVNTNTLSINDTWWENISYTYYGDINAWWILCLTNNVLNPFEEINEGNTMIALKNEYIPYIQRDLGSIFNL